jgi:hypothetical protein
LLEAFNLLGAISLSREANTPMMCHVVTR